MRCWRYTAYMMNTILITGAASGIGYASALALAQRGHTIIATDKIITSLDALREKAKTLHLQNIEYSALDISQYDDWKKALQWPVDILINNAAIGESGPLIEIPLERLEHIWRTNVLGTIGLSQIVAKKMITERTGRIIIVGSTAGLITLPMLGAYNMTKFALESAADALRMELKQWNIAVSLIEPGKIATGFNQRMTATKYEWLNSKSVYGKALETMKERDAKFFAAEYPVDVVVKDILHAVESPKPRPRYITPRRIALGIHIARFLPSMIKDRVLARLY